MPVLVVGPHMELQDSFERRSFWVRTMPQFTVMACFVMGALVLFIWWLRREELLYGLFGIAALLWGLRTLTFVVESLPAEWWSLWRLLYYCATGGFIIVLLLFSLRLANASRPWLERGLVVFWFVGPLGYVVTGGSENFTGRIWLGATIPLGVGILVASAIAAVRQRTWPLISLTIALGLAVVAGVHDYMLANGITLLASLAGTWPGHRIFLLHYGADLLLLVMGAILSARFVAALHAVEELNLTLESRVQERERALAENYARLGKLESQHAANEERHRIMRDLHDGLGSQMFVALSRVEAREIGYDAIGQALRDCIADMRLALEAMGPDSGDFLEAWSNFRFRWERQLELAGLHSAWKTEAKTLTLPAGVSLQLMRIAQEALTNVLKHARATQVSVRLAPSGSGLHLEIVDDGCGVAAGGRGGGRGFANMQARAQRLGGRLEITAANPGTMVRVELLGA